jgi:molybdenum cofactor guanylyltransferase
MPNAREPAAVVKAAAGSVGGYILAGGASRRMGRDKALLPWHGVPLVEWIALQVREAVGNATIAGAPERDAGLGIPAIGEACPGGGPLSGIAAGLGHSPFNLCLVAACGMLLETSHALRRLAAAAIAAGANVYAAVNAGGEPEPLCAVYHLAGSFPISCMPWRTGG